MGVSTIRIESLSPERLGRTGAEGRGGGEDSAAKKFTCTPIQGV